MTESELMDTNTIESLRSVLDDGIYELFEEFISDCPSTIERLEKALDDNNISEINEAAHYLKGSGGNIGAIAFSNACKILEDQARTNSLSETTSHMNKIRELFEETVNYMKSQMN